MLNLEQVRLLEERVQRVISRTGELQRENRDLREKLEGYQERIQELEAHIEQFSSNQAEIEQGVLNALQRLDEVEDAVVEGVQEERTVQTEPALVDDDAGDNAANGDADTDDEELETEEESDYENETFQEEESGPELDIF